MNLKILVLAGTPVYELPYGQNDVSLINKDKTIELLKMLGQWDVSLPHPVFLEGPGWRKKTLNSYDYKYALKQP